MLSALLDSLITKDPLCNWNNPDIVFSLIVILKLQFESDSNRQTVRLTDIQTDKCQQKQMHKLQIAQSGKVLRNVRKKNKKTPGTINLVQDAITEKHTKVCQCV